MKLLNYAWLQKTSAKGNLCDLCCCTPGATGSWQRLLLLGAGRGQRIIQLILAFRTATLLSSTDRGTLAPCFWKCCLSFVCSSLVRALSRRYPTNPSLFPVAVPTLCTVIYSKIYFSSIWFPGSQWTRQAIKHWNRLLREVWMPHSWKYSRTGWTGLWATCPSGRCPWSLQDDL